MKRAKLALLGAVLVLGCLPAAAEAAAWSEPQSLDIELGLSPDLGVDEAGTIVVGGQDYKSAAYVERPAGATSWDSPEVQVTKFPGTQGNANFAFSRSGAAVATWWTPYNAGRETATFWAAYKPAGEPWRPAVELGSAADGDTPPKAVVDDAGHAAVVWQRRPNPPASVLDPHSEIVYSVPSGSSWTAPVKLADIAAPEPIDPDHEDGYDFVECEPRVLAGLMPDGKPVVAWTEAYASYVELDEAEEEVEVGLCAVRATVAGGAVVDVTPRPEIGWAVTPTPEMPSWSASELAVAPDAAETALVLHGEGEGVEIARGTGISFSERGDAGSVGDAHVTVSNGRMLLVTEGPGDVVRAGVGATFPALQTLWEQEGSARSSALAPDGSAHVIVQPNFLAVFDGVRAFYAPPGEPFGAPEVILGWKQAPESLVLDCEGRPTLLRRGTVSNLLSTSSFEGAPAVCSEELGPGLYPEPEGVVIDDSADMLEETGRGSTEDPPATPAPVLWRITIGKPRFDGQGRLVVRAACPASAVGACAGTLSVLRSNGDTVPTGSGARIGRSRFAGLLPGQAKVLRVSLAKPARRALAAGSRLSVVISADARDATGAASVTNKFITLKKPL